MSLADATEAFAAYLNGRPRAVEHFDEQALVEYDADLDRARAAMETAWLEHTTTLASKEPSC